MYLKSIKLKNWRSYRAAQFDFPAPRPNKKVILVGAENGHGKTSLLMALHLGLFGREAVGFIEGFRIAGLEQVKGYRQLLAQTIHRPALELEDPQAVVELEFADPDSGDTISVTRTWNFLRRGQLRDLDDGGEGEEVRITVNDRLQRHKDWKEANALIASRLFPLHVVPCFFFDGEQAQARVEASGGLALSEAVRALYGMALADELSTDLGTFVGNQRQALRREIGDVENAELQRKRGERDQIDLELSQLRKRIEELAAQCADAERQRDAKLFEYQQIGEDFRIDIDQLAKRKTALEVEKSELERRLQDSLASAALPLALRRRAGSIERQLRGEILRDENELVKRDTLPKVDRIVDETLPAASAAGVDPPLTEAQRRALEQRLRQALTALWTPPPEGYAETIRFPFLSSSERASTLEKLRDARDTGGMDMASIAADLQSVQVRLKDVKRQWDMHSDVKPRSEQVRREYEEADARYHTLKSEKDALEHREHGVMKQRNDMSESIGGMEKRAAARAPAERKIEIAERVRRVIDDTRGRLVPLCRSAIAEACTEHFAQMISGEYRRFRVDFDETQQPVLRGPAGELVPVAGMSGAQKRAFGLAFTLAIAQTSDQACPIVIDTPVGNMDSEYRMRVLKYLAKSAPGQLIFLSHDEEISREYSRELETYVAERYLVQFNAIRDGAGVSTPQAGRYFTR